ncbi:hypothetical protein ACFX2F_027180 [Malus domestica]
MSYATGDAQLPVLGHSRVESLSKGRLGPYDAQQEMVLNYWYMLLLCRIFQGDEDKTCFQVCLSSVAFVRKLYIRQGLRLYRRASGLGRIVRH